MDSNSSSSLLFPSYENYRMEETFLRVKLERDELIKRHNRDSTDGKTTTVTEEIANLKTELKRQKAHYEAQFIEYVSNAF